MAILCGNSFGCQKILENYGMSVVITVNRFNSQSKNAVSAFYIYFQKKT